MSFPVPPISVLVPVPPLKTVPTVALPVIVSLPDPVVTLVNECSLQIHLVAHRRIDRLSANRLQVHVRRVGESGEIQRIGTIARGNGVLRCTGDFACRKDKRIVPPSCPI